MPNRDPLDALDAAAAKATPGPWAWDDDEQELRAPFVEDEERRGQPQYDWGATPPVYPASLAIIESDGGFYGPGQSTGRYLALCDPTTIRALVARCRAAEAVCEAAQETDVAWTEESVLALNAAIAHWREVRG